ALSFPPPKVSPVRRPAPAASTQLSPAPPTARRGAPAQAMALPATPAKNTTRRESGTPGKARAGIPAGRRLLLQKSPETTPARQTTRKDPRPAPAESSAFRANIAPARQTPRNRRAARTAR